MNPADLKTRTPYTVIPFNGLFLFLHMETENTAALIRICDEDYRITAQAETIQPATTPTYKGTPQIFDLCAEAIQRYKLEPGRVLRAAVIAGTRGMIGNASKDANGEPIPASPQVKWVRGSQGGFYTVSKGLCTCEDHKNGNTCKHRIAAWIKDESYIRATVAASNQPRAKVEAIYFSLPSYAEIEM